MSVEENSTPQTVQTGQTSNEPFFEIAEDNGDWHWLLWSGNGRELARNAVAYKSKKDVIQSVKAVMDCVRRAKYVVKSHAK